MAASGPVALAFVLLTAPVQAQALLHTLDSPNAEVDGGFSTDVTGLSDVDGDGYGDLLVGAPGEGPGASPDAAGRAYVFSGATGALLYALASPNEEASGAFGASVARVPDTDGDGLGDLAVGAEDETVMGRVEGGRVYVFSGATGALLHTLTSPDLESHSGFGHAVAGIPDVDGDGRGDLVVGAYREDSPPPLPDNVGYAYVYSGATGVLLAELSPPLTKPDGWFGWSVAGLNDVDGNGRGEALVGAPRQYDGEGIALIFDGEQILHQIHSPEAGPRSGFFGGVVSGVPDVDGDGREDVLIGADEEDTFRGQAHVFSGATGDLLYTIEAPVPTGSGYFGGFGSGVPDVDGDGRGDLVVGGVAYSGSGVAYVFSGADGLLLYELLSPNGGELEAASGIKDVDGDHRGDVIAGVPGEPSGSGVPDAGRAYVYSGAFTSTPVEADGPKAPAVTLSEPAPNPSTGRITLAFTLAGAEGVRLAIHDVLGREVAVLVDGTRVAGWHEAVLEGGSLPAGTYLVRLEAGGTVQARCLTLAR